MKSAFGQELNYWRAHEVAQLGDRKMEKKTRSVQSCPQDVWDSCWGSALPQEDAVDGICRTWSLGDMGDFSSHWFCEQEMMFKYLNKSSFFN